MEEAIQHLEQAAKLVPLGQPGAVAARAMLAVACLKSFRFRQSRFVELWRELEQLAPISPEDFLFKGYAEATLEPTRGLQTIQQALARRPTMAIAPIYDRKAALRRSTTKTKAKPTSKKPK